MSWLLERYFSEQMAQAKCSNRQFASHEMEAMEEAEAKTKSSISGNVAIIPIEGVLTQKRDFFAAFFGGGNTLYPDIQRAVVEANADKMVSEIFLQIGSSPGGSIDGLFDTMAVIKSSKKPVRAFVRDMAASATYALVSQADEVIASNRATRFGSVGIVSTFRVDADYVDVTSTDAPDKRPDVTTKDGLEAARRPLDAIHREFVKEIAKGRGETPDAVNENYGRGAIVIAADAIKKGMIDKIGISKTKPTTQKTASQGGEEVSMKTLAEFKAAHPALYAEAVEVGKAEANSETMDLIKAHAHGGRESGDLETALEAIENLTPVTALITMKYQMAAVKKGQLKARQEDTIPDFDGGIGASEKPEKTEDEKVIDEAYAIIDGSVETDDAVDCDAIAAEMGK
jgi:ClpP class serine protease